MVPHRLPETYEDLKASSAAWICSSCGEINYSQHAFQSSIWGFGDLTTNQYHPVSPGQIVNTTANSQDTDTNHFGLPLYTSSPLKDPANSKPYKAKKPKKKRVLRVLSLNCQSLRNKPELLENIADSLKPDVIIGTESWLIPPNKEKGIHNSEVFPEGYTLSAFRRDRQEVPCYSDTPDIRGGGTFVLLKDDITGVRQTELETDCEITWTKFELAGSKAVHVASYYRPHEKDIASLDEFQKSLERICNHTSSHIWIGGDFNFPGYNWANEHLKPGCKQPVLTRRFLDIIADCGLTQIVKTPTYYENTLDLFLTNNPSIVCNTQVVPGISSDGHHAVYVEIDVNPSRRIKKPRKVHSFKKADWDSLKTHSKNFCNQVLDNTTTDTPVNDLWKSFTSHLNEGVERFVPTIMTKAKERPPWITPDVGRLLRRQRKLFDKQRGCAYASRAAKHYRTLKAYTQRTIRQAYWQYLEGVIGETDSPANEGSGPTPSKRFWQFIRHRRQDAQGVAPLKREGKLVDDPVEKATILNTQFQSVFSPRTPLTLSNLCERALNFRSATPKPGTGTPTMPEINITENGVLKQLKRLKPHKAAGPDQIKPGLLRELAEEISPLVTRIFQASLKQGTLPDEWKEALVTPVYKKGERLKAVNYRPISLTCVLCKQMEHIIASQLMSHLNNNSLLYNKQHGFRSKLSCESQLIEFTNDVLGVVQDRRQCDTIVLDFSKAFDKVSHDRLLFKLDRAGVNTSTRNWIKSFLLDRSQRVIVDGETSSPAPVTSGVPQGSVLGPILFLVFINDLPQYTKHSQVRLFADDTIVYLSVSSIDDCHRLQEDLGQLEQWERDWLMEFHPSKCSVLRITRKKSKTVHPYSLHGHILEEVPSAKYLGVTISDDMTWNRHVESTASKANGRLGFLKRNLKVRDPRLRESAYKAIVRPTLEYCSSVWDPHTHQQAHRLEMVQRRAARWVTGRYHNTSSVTSMIQDLGWRDLAQRRADARLCMLFKITHSLVDIPVGQYITFHRDQIHIQPIFARTNYYLYSFFPRTVSDWNALPPETLRAGTVATFKTKVAASTHTLPY